MSSLVTSWKSSLSRTSVDFHEVARGGNGKRKHEIIFRRPLSSGETIRVHVISILDDATRAILAARVVTSVDLAAAVAVFHDAAHRWGLPLKLYADRASVFDSEAFRTGMAMLGSTRIWTRPRNAPARGKIEAYHRVLGLWFVKRLKAQQVHDLVHLQSLLTGVIEALYQSHKHRSIKQPLAEALAGKTSPRVVPPAQLTDAFLQRKLKRAHTTTGEVELQDATWLVPDTLRQERGRLCFFLDPTRQAPPQVFDPITETRLPLRRAAVKPGDVEKVAEPWGAGPLQTLYDDWRGQRRPQAEHGFGLPELYRLLAEASGRVVPQTDREAALVQQWYRQHGPLPGHACTQALAAIGRELGSGRPLTAYLDALTTRIHPGDDP